MESGTARLAISNDDTNHDSGDCDLTVLLVSVYGETRARESRRLCDLAEWKSTVSEKRRSNLWICVDEAKNFTVGYVCAKGQQV